MRKVLISILAILAITAAIIGVVCLEKKNKSAPIREQMTSR